MLKEIKCKQMIITTIVVLIAIIITLHYLYHYWSDGIYSKFGYDKGLEIFYTMNNTGLFSIFTFIIAFLSSGFINIVFYQNKYNDFQKYIITRVGYQKRLLYEIKTVVKVSFMMRFFLHVFLIVIIHLCYSRFAFTEYSDITFYYDGVAGLFGNSKVSLLLYILYSSIGFSVFSLFLYSLIYFIKNKYIYKVSGIILCVLLTISGSLIGNQLYKMFDNIKFANPLLQAVATISLFSPGVNGFTTITTLFETHIYFWYTCFCFMIYSFIFIVIRYRRERKNG